MANQTDIFDFLEVPTEEVEEGVKYTLTVTVAISILTFKRLRFEFNSMKDMNEFKSKLKIYSEKQSRTSSEKEKLFIIVVYPNAFINQYIEKRGKNSDYV